jgi:hypothetical protein
LALLGSWVGGPCEEPPVGLGLSRPDFALSGFLSVGFQTDQKSREKNGDPESVLGLKFEVFRRPLSVKWHNGHFHVQYMAFALRIAWLGIWA